jgi:nitrogen fixation protein
MASYHLSNALENMRDLALYIPQYDLDEDIQSVAEQIEAIILKEALRTKKNFIPVYVSSNEY